MIAATHDIELANLLHRHFDLDHFCEQVIDDNLYFDYKLHEGMLRKRNAIRILEISGFPRSVIAEAELIASQLEQKTNK